MEVESANVRANANLEKVEAKLCELITPPKRLVSRTAKSCLLYLGSG